MLVFSCLNSQLYLMQYLCTHLTQNSVRWGEMERGTVSSCRLLSVSPNVCVWRSVSPAQCVFFLVDVCCWEGNIRYLCNSRAIMIDAFHLQNDDSIKGAFSVLLLVCFYMIVDSLRENERKKSQARPETKPTQPPSPKLPLVDSTTSSTCSITTGKAVVILSRLRKKWRRAESLREEGKE